jgi:hypothetical protein
MKKERAGYSIQKKRESVRGEGEGERETAATIID